MKRTIVFGLVVTLTLATAHGLSAIPQRRGGSGTLTGVVLGPDDKPVPHAAVTYQSSAGIAPHAVHADASGHFSITKLRSDDYDLRASSRGVFSEWEKNVAVRSGRTKSVTLRLIYAKEVPKAYTKGNPNPQRP
jgi:Carboxypeptidase regulatory-like domain